MQLMVIERLRCTRKMIDSRCEKSGAYVGSAVLMSGYLYCIRCCGSVSRNVCSKSPHGALLSKSGPLLLVSTKVTSLLYRNIHARIQLLARLFGMISLRNSSRLSIRIKQEGSMRASFSSMSWPSQQLQCLSNQVLFARRSPPLRNITPRASASSHPTKWQQHALPDRHHGIARPMLPSCIWSLLNVACIASIRIAISVCSNYQYLGTQTPSP